MSDEPTIFTTGGTNGEYYTVTATFSVQLNDVQLKDLDKELQLILREQKVMASINRVVKMFARNGKTVAIIDYRGNVQDHNMGCINGDLEALLKQLDHLLRIFGSPSAA